MPTVFRQFNIRMFFYSHDHEPIHVHVTDADSNAKIVLAPKIEVVSSSGFNQKELNYLKQICEVHKDDFIAQWEEHFES